MTVIGMRCKRGYRTLAECEACPRRCILIPVIHELRKKQGQMPAVAASDASSGYYFFRDNEYHVTSLLGCPRKAVLGRLCGEYNIPLNQWKMLIGTLCHDFMEHHPYRVGVAEKLLTCTFDVDGGEKATVVGRFDWLDTKNDIVIDYKFIWDNIQYLPKISHFRQVATYALIGTKGGIFAPGQIKGGQIEYTDVTTGFAHVYRIDGDVFAKYYNEMSVYIPVMIEHYHAAQKGLLPPGDPARDECNYCAPEFKAHCCEGKNVKPCAPANTLNDAATVKASIEAYRRENTPPDDELDVGE